MSKYQWLSPGALSAGSTSTSSSNNGSTSASNPYASGHLGVQPSVTTSTNTAPAPTTPNVSNGGFLDFMIAVFAMILVLQAHKLTRSFLDHLFPGGGGHGPGSLMSGLMEGVGMSAGSAIFNKGKGLVKTGAGMGGAATVGGLAAAHKYMKENGGAFGKDGILGGIKKMVTPDLKQLNAPGVKALPPDQGTRMNGPNGFTMGDAPGGAGASSAGATGTSSGTGTGSMSFGPSMGSASTSSSSTSGLFDPQSNRNGAHTQLRPSAQGKMDELSKLAKRDVKGGVFGAFAKGAGDRFKVDAKHKLMGGKGKYAGGANSVLGVAGQEFSGKSADERAENQIMRDTYLPGKDLMAAADKNDPMALSDLAQIGQHQSEMEEGMQWIDQGQTMQQAIQPQYDQAEAEFDAASQERDGLSIMMNGYIANGQENTPEFAQIQEKYQVADQRFTGAQKQFKLRETQMGDAQNMVSRGEQRVVSSQNAIGKINMGWYPENMRNAPRFVQAAQARANRKTLSDLGQAPSSGAKRSRR